jgi:restriction system protein
MRYRSRQSHRRVPLTRQLARVDCWLWTGVAVMAALLTFFVPQAKLLPGEPWHWSAGIAGFFAALAVNSRLDARRRREWARNMRGVENLMRLDWRQFERWAAEAYRAQGYRRVQVIGGGGADGGVDLVCTGPEGTVLVQCKHWKSSVGAKTVREMYGLMHHHKAGRADIVALKGFTRDAREFVKNKPMRLLDGKATIALLQQRRK